MPSHRSFPRLFHLLFLLILVTLVLPCPAAELEKEDTMIPLHVAAGTNLIHLARDYCRDRSDWHEIARINRLTEPYLIIHDTSLQVPLSLLIVEKLSATVASVHGPVDLLTSKDQTIPLNKGDVLLPGQTVRTGPDGYTHLILPDNTYTRVEPDSQITLTYLFRLKDGNVKADFFLGRGTIIHWVREKLRANESFQTRTPIAVTGIRGTEFRLKMAEKTANTVETLRVIDQGPGIAREERQRIFDKFQRGNQTAKADGFGLGLHLVKQIVDRHHGNIAVLDGDEGAVFQIILPKLDQTVGETGAFPCA